MKCHHIGPVKVPLANRLSLLERWLARDHIDVRELLRCFTQARSLFQASVLLDCERHPAIASQPRFRKRGGASKLHPVLTAVCYNCSIESIYRSLATHIKDDKASKDKQRRAENKAMGRIVNVSWRRVRSRLMFDHFAKLSDSGKFYSCPMNSLSITSLSGFVDEPASKRRRQAGALNVEGDLVHDGEAEDGGRDLVFFQPIHTNPGRKKTLELVVDSRSSKCWSRCTTA